MIFVNPDARANRDIPNIGLALAATYYGARVIDLNTMPVPSDRFLNKPTDVLGISVQSRTYNEAFRIRSLFAEKYPMATVKSVSGFIDVQCCYPYLSLENDLNPGIPFGDEIPFPDYGLFDSINLFKLNWQSGLWRYAIMTSLGCPFSCIYCSAGKRQIDTRSVEHCIEELKIAKERWGITKFIILDDCFNAKKERVVKFCDMVRPLGLVWGCANGLRADRFDDDIAQALHSSGCDFISFGVESSDDEVLRRIRKGETVGQIEQAVSIAGNYFPMVNGYFIIGLPGSTYGKDLMSLKWALKHTMNAHFSYYVPAGSDLSCDSVFYGSGAGSVSDEYPRELQEKLFKMTACMRADYSGSLMKRVFNKLFLVLKFAPSAAPRFLLRGLRSHFHE